MTSIKILFKNPAQGAENKQNSILSKPGSFKKRTKAVGC
jgi:hypothetical protein